MEVINNRNVWSIIVRTLNHVDQRLVSHGEHVAYLTYKLMEFQGGYTPKELSSRMLVSLLHDVGAYKTEEIDNMVEFETNSSWEHSIYGYLFLKRLSTLKDRADIVLYHHMKYQDYIRLPYRVRCQQEALLLKLLDRVDVLLTYGKNQVDTNYLIRNKGILFDPGQVELFIRADKELHLIDKLASGEYQQELDEIVKNIHFEEDEKRRYLRMIAYSIDFRSEYMVLHTVTTNSLSCAIAEQFHFNTKDMWKIYFGSLLHDLGKVSTPLEILEKPGSLTPDEMKVMRRHVEITGDILGDYVESDIYKIAVRHHEKLDGSGYPLGLTGDQLSLSERIVAVADIVSALIRKRSYKEAFSTPLIRRILTEMRDQNQICPEVTNLVLDKYDLLLTVSEANSREVLTVYQGIKQEYQDIMQRVHKSELVSL